MERNRELKRSIDETNRVINELKTSSFLISEADPSIVVPSFMLSNDDNAFSPSIGDYAAVIYGGKIYPAIVGDAGPSSKMGEASGRICKEINPRTSGFEPGSQQHQSQLSHLSRNRRDTRPARPGSMAPKVQGAARRNRRSGHGTACLEGYRSSLANSNPRAQQSHQPRARPLAQQPRRRRSFISGTNSLANAGNSIRQSRQPGLPPFRHSSLRRRALVRCLSVQSVPLRLPLRHPAPVRPEPLLPHRLRAPRLGRVPR